MKPALSPDLFTVNEAALYLRVSRTTVYTLIADGDLPTIKIRRRRFVQ